MGSINKSSIIWMNVTTSVNWQRPPVGIVRVEQSLSNELGLIYGKNFKLCIWGEDRFIEYDPESIIQDSINARTNKINIFNAEDILLSVGLDWDHDYFRKFYHIRKEFGVRVVTCCYDLIPVLYPQYCVGNVASLFENYFIEIADASNLILCISKNTQNDLLTLLNKTGSAIPPTHVFPLGDNVPKIEGDVISEEVKKIVADKFILYVSTIERRKNHDVLYKAYHILCEKGLNDLLPQLVFIGMKGWGVEETFKDIELDPLIAGSIVILNNVNDSELRLLYDASLFCVYPSLYEGWGLPVGEALALGKAVISSPKGSLPEVGGNLVSYADPWNPHEWADEILYLTTNECKRYSRQKSIKSKYKVKTWSNSAQSIAKIINSLLLKLD